MERKVGDMQSERKSTTEEALHALDLSLTTAHTLFRRSLVRKEPFL